MVIVRNAWTVVYAKIEAMRQCVATTMVMAATCFRKLVHMNLGPIILVTIITSIGAVSLLVVTLGSASLARMVCLIELDVVV